MRVSVLREPWRRTLLTLAGYLVWFALMVVVLTIAARWAELNVREVLP